MNVSTHSPCAGQNFNNFLPSSSEGGKKLRDAVLDVLRIRRAELIRQCSVAAIHFAIRCGEVSADEVRAFVEIPSDISPKLVGVVFKDLADAGILRRVGYRASTRAVAHARPLSVWELESAAAAQDWLDSHRSRK
jgi:hypothetical protein